MDNLGILKFCKKRKIKLGIGILEQIKQSEIKTYNKLTLKDLDKYIYCVFGIKSREDKLKLLLN